MPTLSSDSWREPARFDWTRLLRRPDAASSAPLSVASVRGRRLLVTGAGGYIGSAMVHLLAASGAAQIVLLEIAERNLFEIASATASAGFADRCIPILGSVCDRALLEEIFREHQPEIILHAAALKHVPLMERNPLAAVETNSLGTQLLAEVAAAHAARHMILVSTDKAVAPHSIMGASKRIAELAMLAQSGLCATVVRLANVLGSPGSVGPLFAGQIARGGPLTVTHPEARRFFLTLEEVIQLLAETIQLQQSGILIPDPGEPLAIAELARRMLAATGRDLSIAYTAVRPGDKLSESLVSATEHVDQQLTPGLRRITTPAPEDFAPRMDELRIAAATRDRARLLQAVQDLVPDYQPSICLLESPTEPQVVRA